MIDVVDWIRAIRTRRDLLPIGVAGYLPDPVLRDVLMKELRIRPVLHLPAPPLYASEAVLNDLAQESIVPELLEEWARRFGSPTGDVQRIAQIIAEAGACGKRLRPAFACAGVSRSTVHRALRRGSWPTAGALWSDARVSAVEIRMRGGVPRCDALGAVGWFSAKDYNRCVARLKAHGKIRCPP